MINIIGAGPAGSFAAYSLAKAGYDVDIYEDNNEVGKPVQCTGLVTSSILDVIKIKPEVIVNKIRHATIISPNKKSVTISMQKPNIILSRCGFDKYVAELAQDAGAGIFVGTRFIRGTNKTWTVKKDNKVVEKIRGEKDYLIGADGPNTTVGKSFGLVKNHTLMYGAQASVVMKDMPQDTLEFYPLPEGYYWAVPEGNNIVRVGVAVYEHPNDHLKRILKMRCEHQKVLEYQGGIIPRYDPKIKTYDRENRVMLIGDAATQVKWTTGGGIIQGMIAAGCAAKAIVTKQNYETLWRAKLGKELWLHRKIRDVMDKFTYKDYDKLVELTSQARVKKIFQENDRDQMMSFFFSVLLSEPRYLLFGRKLL